MVVTTTTRSVAYNPATSYLEVGYQNSAGSVQAGGNNPSSCDHLSSSTRKRAWLITETWKAKHVEKCVFVFFIHSLIIHYYDLGHSYNEVLAALLGAHGICIR